MKALLETCLGRIDAWEDQIHAWVSVDRDGARRVARECDRELTRRRSVGSVAGLSPLFGIPIGIKDIIDIAGQPTGAGSELRASGPPAEREATVVQKLREAGAIILGKTVTTQFACFDPPPTRNPWNLDHTPGGSSSGSAAAVAAGMCLGAIGSQTGGSIIRPASFCGVAGCKPTYRRVSCDGFVPAAPSLDTPGPLAACVADLAMLLNAISGGDAADASVDPARDLALDLADLKPEKIRPPRLALLGGFFDQLADPSMRLSVNRAATRLRSAGASVIEADLPPTFSDIHARHRTIVGFELAAFHRDRLRKLRADYLPGLAVLIVEGETISADDYAASLDHQQRATADAEELSARRRRARLPGDERGGSGFVDDWRSEFQFALDLYRSADDHFSDRIVLRRPASRHSADRPTL